MVAAYPGTTAVVVRGDCTPYLRVGELPINIIRHALLRQTPGLQTILTTDQTPPDQPTCTVSSLHSLQVRPRLAAVLTISDRLILNI